MKKTLPTVVIFAAITFFLAYLNQQPAPSTEEQRQQQMVNEAVQHHEFDEALKRPSIEGARAAE